MELLISPKHKVNWKIDTVFLLNSLRELYKSIKIEEIKDLNRTYLYTWKVELNEWNYFLEGALFRNQNCIIFKTNKLDESIDFLKLCRISMPDDEDVIIYDDMFNNYLPLILDQQKQQLDNLDDILNTFY